MSLYPQASFALRPNPRLNKVLQLARGATFTRDDLCLTRAHQRNVQGRFPCPTPK